MIYDLRFKNKIKKHPRGSAIFTAMFMLFGVITIAGIGFSIVMSGLMSRKAHGASAKAYYAAESGVEKTLSYFSPAANSADYKNFFSSCPPNNFNGYNVVNLYPQATNKCVSDNSNPFTSATDGTQYYVRAYRDNGINANQVTLFSQGSYNQTNRRIQVSFCLPICNGLGSDGCGGSCSGN